MARYAIHDAAIFKIHNNTIFLIKYYITLFEKQPKKTNTREGGQRGDGFII